ncbi:MAG TPA: hypothetical protein VF517_02930 [Thermoleophilaceae bacterium]|jgi:hypothetical protein
MSAEHPDGGGRREAAGPTARPRYEEAERRMRAIVADAGLPEPDDVEYEDTSIFLYWHEQKLVVEIADIPVTPPGPAEEPPATGGDAACRDA